MRRLPVLAALTVVALIAASAWLAIVAQSDPEPLPTAERLPRDDDQSQQQESQAEPEPGPDQEDAEQQSSDQQSSEQRPSEEEASGQLEEEEETERSESVEPSAQPVDVLIAALDVPRSPIEPDPAPETTLVIEFETYVVEPGDTLVDIAEHMELDLPKLITANELDSPDLLHVGLELAVPREVVVIEPVEATDPPYEPVEIAPTVTENGIVYGTIRDHERGVVNSAVIATSMNAASVRLVESCIDRVRRTFIMGLQLPEGPARIYWRFDDGPLSTDRWTAGDELVESISSSPFLHTLAEQLGVGFLWIRIGGQDLTFEIENLVPDEIAGNFSDCAS